MPSTFGSDMGPYFYVKIEKALKNVMDMAPLRVSALQKSLEQPVQ